MKATIVIFLLTVPFAQERTVRGVMQARPGADAEDVEVKVHLVVLRQNSCWSEIKDLRPSRTA